MKTAHDCVVTCVESSRATLSRPQEASRCRQADRFWTQSRQRSFAMAQCTSRLCSAATCRSTTCDLTCYLMGFLWAIWLQASCLRQPLAFRTHARDQFGGEMTPNWHRDRGSVLNFVKVHTVAAVTAPRSAQQLRTKAPAKHIQKHWVVQKYLPASATCRMCVCMPVNASGVAPEH